MRTTLWFMLAAATPLAAAARTAPGACTYRGTVAELRARLSPLDSTQVSVDGATVKVCYGRPSIRGREIMGGLVPYGAPWRLGANEPTRLVLPFAAQVAGVRVPPGTYSLYVVPQKTTWAVHVNKAVDRWGIPIDEQVEAQDVGTGSVPVEALAQPVDTLTLRLVAGTPTELVATWEKARVRIPIRKIGEK
jgi:Protein of unknown function (DUF2911)